MTVLADLADELGVGERTLRRAVNHGVLRARRSSPRKLEMTVSERIYVRRSWALLSALRRALRTERNVRFAMLFGSAATGASSTRSDVDILVDLRDPRLESVVDLQGRLSAAVGRPVHIVRLRDAEVDPAFRGEVVRDGRVLVDRAGLWPRLCRREARSRRRVDAERAQRLDRALAGIDRLLAG